MWEPGRVSSATPQGSPVKDDSKISSIAWAVAVIVVALAAAFIAWLAMGRDDAGTASPAGQTTSASAPTPGATPSPSDPAATSSAAGADSTSPSPPETTPEEQAQTADPQVEQMMLDLQRRDPDDVMAVGDVDAPVVMIEYADYRCPYCAAFTLETRPGLQRLVDDGTLRIEFRDLVLFEETSQLAAVAARAAAAQGHLDDYQAEVFALSKDGHGEFDQADLVKIAKEVGVEDLQAFKAAFDDPTITAAVQADTDEARAIGVQSTPTFLINTQVVQGAYPLADFERVIEEERQKAEEAAAATGR